MAANALLQIVSGFLPDSDGMGDFSRRMGDMLWRKKGIPSHYLVYRRPKAAFDAAEIAPNTVSYPPETTPKSCLEEITCLLSQHNFGCILLHYGPYAYSSNGRPAEFAKAMQSLAAQRKVLVFFHETYALGRPWKRAFWTCAEQKQALRTLLSSASATFTSASVFMRRLEKLNDNQVGIEQIRIFSNVGEPSQLTALDRRSRRLVVFGRLTTRVHLYRDHRPILEEICKLLDIETVADVGVGNDPAIPAAIGQARVQSYGWMSEDRLSELLADSIAGVIAYSPDYWEKSGVLAAYAAHGMTPILAPEDIWHETRPPVLPFTVLGQLRELAGSGTVIPQMKIQTLADHAHRFYVESQSVGRCVEVITPHLL